VNAFGRTAPSAAGPRSILYLLVGVAGAALCLTLIFLSMRSVMDVGGQCADGGPYVSRQSCPSGVTVALLGGIFGLFGFGALAAIGGTGVGGRYGGIIFLAWPALFLSLGWNFLEYGVRPPGGDGPDAAWLLCGVVFVVMGGGPLLGMLPRRGSTARRDPMATRRLLSDLQARQRQLRADERGPDSATGDPLADRTDLTSRLERLAALRSAGSLTEAEFDEAKRRVIAEVASGR
jgi:hypothetical protein